MEVRVSCRKKMEERLLLNRIDMDSTWVTIRDGVQLAFVIHPISANADVPTRQDTTNRTLQTFETAIHLFVEHCLLAPLPKII